MSQAKNSRLVSVQCVDSSLVKSLKAQLFDLIDPFYTNTIVAMRIDNNLTVQRMPTTHSSSEPFHTPIQQYYIIELIVCEPVVDASVNIDDHALLEMVKAAAVSQQNDNNLPSEINVVYPESLNKKGVLENLYKLSEVDNECFIKNFVGYPLHLNTKIVHTAKVKLRAYLTALSTNDPKATEYDYHNITMRDQFFQQLPPSARGQAFTDFMATIIEMHRSTLTWKIYTKIHGDWRDECSRIYNKWVESMNSPDGPQHKQPHLLLYGPANQGKTSFIMNELFGGLHKSVRI
jgi:hypothetical protein